MNKTKKEGQVFTPTEIVKLVLDAVGYQGASTLTKSIIEPSFGEGAFLVEITKRVIEQAKIEGESTDSILRIIKNNIFGIEKDTALYATCVQNLNALLQENGLQPMNWSRNLFNEDTILFFGQFEGRFDFVVGNPPYIRIHNLSPELREVLATFKFAQGMTDMYILFYELGLRMLNNNGKLGFITPNSFLKNASQQRFRDHIIEYGYLSSIFDFKTSKIFEGFGVYACICVLDKHYSATGRSIVYKEFEMMEPINENIISMESFKQSYMHRPWNFGSAEEMSALNQNRAKPVKLSDIAVVQNGVATNCDEVFIGRAWVEQNESTPFMKDPQKDVPLVWFNGHPVESNLLRRCVKASRYNGVMDNTYILFPYKTSTESSAQISGGCIVPLDEEELSRLFPKAYQYLQKHRIRLEARDMEPSAHWYQFARSQGLANSGQKKIVFKHILVREHPDIHPFVLDEDVIVYSGLFTTISDNSGKSVVNRQKWLQFVLNLYVTPEFSQYCALVGKDMSGGYIAVSSKHIKEYGIDIGVTMP